MIDLSKLAKIEEHEIDVEALVEDLCVTLDKHLNSGDGKPYSLVSVNTVASAISDFYSATVSGTLISCSEANLGTSEELIKALRGIDQLFIKALIQGHEAARLSFAIHQVSKGVKE